MQTDAEYFRSLEYLVNSQDNILRGILQSGRFD